MTELNAELAAIYRLLPEPRFSRATVTVKGERVKALCISLPQ